MARRITNEEILNRLSNLKDFEEYDILNETIHGSTKKATFIHRNCPENGSDYRFNMIIKDFIGGQRCPRCAAKKRILSNTKIKDKEVIIHKKSRQIYNLNKYIEQINSTPEYEYISINDTRYTTVHTKVNIKHKTCDNIFVKRISDFIYNKQLCPICTGKGGKKKDISETIRRLDEAGFELFQYSGGHLYTSSTYLLKCKKCRSVQERSLNTIINLHGQCDCQIARGSKGERIINEILSDANIFFLKNKTFEGLISVSSLKCDFYIPKYNAIIEYDGYQHFRDCSFISGTLDERHKRDLIKNKFCTDNNIKILRISYKERNKQKITKIINEFLNLIDKIDGKPYDGKLSRTVWVGGKSNYEDYFKYNSK